VPALCDVQTRHRARSACARRAWGIGLVAFAVFAVVVLGAAFVTIWNITRSFDAVEKIPNAFPADDVIRPPTTSGMVGATTNYLLLGSDARGTHAGSIADLDGERADTIVIVHVPADRTHLSVMSIPRHSLLEVPGHGERTIKDALSYGGVPLAVQTVERVIGSRVDHVAVVDFGAFKAVTDALGGVEIDNPVAFTSYQPPGHIFPQGSQSLDGTEALAFARERSALADGEFQRVRNQQLLTRALLGGIMQESVRSDPSKVGSIVGAVTPHVAIDDALTPADMIALGAQLGEVQSDDVSFFTIPTVGTGTTDDGQPVVNLDWAALPALRDAFRNDTLGGSPLRLQAAG